MLVYRVVKLKSRTRDLSGTGAFTTGGRWNSKGTYILYTSETSSLAYLETLIHFDDTIYPPHLFIMEIEVNDKAPVDTLPDKKYPKQWKRPGLLKNQQIGNLYMHNQQHLGLKVKSAINTLESNLLLNPLYPRFYDLVKVKKITEIQLDRRFF
ncbi:MAG: RES family NAD+ phosphorylase [Chitinophagaceae bacterium]|nr:RES family NAD+ phosphorylase [Chitinophagaceae bacterium]